MALANSEMKDEPEKWNIPAYQETQNSTPRTAFLGHNGIRVHSHILLCRALSSGALAEHATDLRLVYLPHSPRKGWPWPGSWKEEDGKRMAKDALGYGL